MVDVHTPHAACQSNQVTCLRASFRVQLIDFVVYYIHRWYSVDEWFCAYVIKQCLSLQVCSYVHTLLTDNSGLIDEIDMGNECAILEHASSEM